MKYLFFILLPISVHSQFSPVFTTGFQPNGMFIGAGVTYKIKSVKPTIDFLSMINHQKDATFFGGKIEAGKRIQAGVGLYYQKYTADKTEYTIGKNKLNPYFSIAYQKNWFKIGVCYLDRPLLQFTAKLN